MIRLSENKKLKEIESKLKLLEKGYTTYDTFILEDVSLCNTLLNNHTLYMFKINNACGEEDVISVAINEPIKGHREIKITIDYGASTETYESFNDFASKLNVIESYEKGIKDPIGTGDDDLSILICQYYIYNAVLEILSFHNNPIINVNLESKQAVKAMKERLKELGYDVKLTHCYEVLARIDGYKNRHHVPKESNTDDKTVNSLKALIEAFNESCKKVKGTPIKDGVKISHNIDNLQQHLSTENKIKHEDVVISYLWDLSYVEGEDLEEFNELRNKFLQSVNELYDMPYESTDKDGDELEYGAIILRAKK